MPFGHLIAATMMTLGVCQGHSSIASFSILTRASRGPAAIGELLVMQDVQLHSPKISFGNRQTDGHYAEITFAVRSSIQGLLLSLYRCYCIILSVGGQTCNWGTEWPLLDYRTIVTKIYCRKIAVKL